MRRGAFSQAFQAHLAGTAAPDDFGSLNDLFDNRLTP